MSRPVKLPVPRPSYESMIERLDIPKERQKKLLAIMADQEEHETSVTAGNILLVMGTDGSQRIANMASAELAMGVEVAEGCKAALAALRRRNFIVVVVDESVAEGDPSGAESVWEHSGLAIPLQVNLALSGTARLVREIRAALHRREREQDLARQAAAAALESELKSAVAGLLLQSQLGLNSPEERAPAVDKLLKIADLAKSLRAS